MTPTTEEVMARFNLSDADWDDMTDHVQSSLRDALEHEQSCVNVHDEMVEALNVAADIQHETSQSRGETDCTETTPCVFCSLIAKAEGRAES